MSPDRDAMSQPLVDFSCDQRLRKVERLLKRAEFLRVQRRGRRSSSARLVVYVAPNGLAWSRLGVTVSKKVSNRAVVRNRWKRLLREAFRCNKQHLPTGVDLVVVVAPKALSSSRDEVASELLPLVARATQLARSQKPQPARASAAERPGPSDE